MSRTVYVSLSAAALAVVGTLVLAGPLSPPSGPIASTYKTLAEVEPRIAINATNTPGDALNSFIISQPGSYYLTGNITGVSGKSGIKITASNVTLDLNGFTLQGVSGSQYGILAQVFPNNCTVRNGVVNGWGQAGVLISSAGGSGRGSIIESIHSYGNTGIGIAAADGSIVRNCVANDNGTGIDALGNCLITGCTALSNTSVGISCNTGTVEHCVTKENGTHGITCGGSIVRGNSCASNGASVNDGCGIQAVGNGCVIENNHCSLNDTGIEAVSSNNKIDSNNCSGNLIGLNIAGTNNLIIRNSVFGGVRFNIGVNNSVAPIVTVATNNNWPAVANSNHPMANFGY